MLALGGVLTPMNAPFYLATAALPLGTVAAIEFAGVVVLAQVPTAAEAAGVALVVAGVALRSVSMEPVGERRPS